MFDSPVVVGLLVLAAVVVVGVLLSEIGFWIARGWGRVFGESEAEPGLLELGEQMEDDQDYEDRLEALEDENQRLRDEIGESLF